MQAVATATARRGRPVGNLGTKRQEIFRRAAPLLRSLGYHGVTMKAIGRCVSLAPASLYHYFPSKRALALYPLGPDNDICERIRRSIDAIPASEPLLRIRVLVDHWLDELPDALLAVHLAGQAGVDGMAAADAKERSELGLRTLASVVAAAVPGMNEERALELGRVLLSMLVGSPIVSLDRSQAELGRHMISVLRLYVVPPIDPQRFDAAFPS
jgi:AcrR family transcriptional regulator